MTLKVFFGSSNKYAVLSCTQAVCFGVSMAPSEKYSDVVVRFATLGYPEKAPKYLNFRKNSPFEMDGAHVAGMHYDLVEIPVLDMRASAEQFAAACIEHKVVEVLLAWAITQIQKEIGMDAEWGDNTELAAFFSTSLGLDKSVVVFTPPLAIEHNP